MLAVQQMQQQQTVQRARAHVDAQRATAEAMSEAEAAARLLTQSGTHLSESVAVAEAAGARRSMTFVCHAAGPCTIFVQLNVLSVLCHAPQELRIAP